MDIGLIISDRSFVSELQDLTDEIKRRGHEPLRIEIDNMVIKIKSGKLLTYHMGSPPKEELIDPQCAVMRHIGYIKDYEQLSQRIWAVKSLEMNGSYVANNIKSWLQASDKLGALMELSKRGLPVPDTISTENVVAAYGAVKEFKSAVVKPLRGGAGFGVFKTQDPDVAMHVFSYFINLSKPLYVQRFLNKKNNGDYRVIVVGDEVIGAEFRKGKDWKSNVSQGAKATRARPDAELCEIAIKAAQAMNLDYVGVDIADTKDGYYILETNPTIAWGTFKKITKVNPAEHIIEHIINRARA